MGRTSTYMDHAKATWSCTPTFLDLVEGPTTSCTLPPRARSNPTKIAWTKLPISSFYTYITHKIDQIKAALRELTLQDTPNITTVAKKHGCNRITLSRRFQKVTVSKHTVYNKQKFLNDIQSKSLIKYINDLTEQGLSPTVIIVRNITAGITGRLPGVN
jgi:AraC-like DNA-binding protein